MTSLKRLVLVALGLLLFGGGVALRAAERSWLDDLREARRICATARAPEEFQGAAALLERALAKDPPAARQPELLYWLGRARFDGKDSPGAVEALRRAAAAAPAEASYRLWLGYAYNQDGRTTLAVRTLRSVAADPAAAPDEQQSARDWLKTLHEPADLEALAPEATLVVPGGLIRYHAGDPFAAVAREALAAARVKLDETLGIKLDEPAVEIFLFRDAAEYLAYHTRRGQPRQPWSTACAAHGRIFTYGTPTTDRAALTSTLTHEYTHVALRALADDRTLPCWLDEGLAMLLSGQFSDADTILANTRPWLALAALQVPGFGGYPEDWARLAYAQSRAMAAYLLKSAGAVPVRAYVRALGRQTDADAAFQASFGVSTADFYVRWTAEQTHVH